MPLLQLPPEIFERILYYLISSQKLKDVFRYREVCRAFYDYISAEICEQASQMTPDQMLASPELKKIFRTHGALVLTKRVMRGKDEGNVVLEFVQECVSFALSQGLGEGDDQETRRLQCTSMFCKLLLIRSRYSLEEYLKGTNDVRKAVKVYSMRETIPPIAAALNNSELLSKHAPSSWHMVTPSCKILPCALNAAVAFGSTKTLSLILTCLEKGDGTDGFPRIGLQIALKMAIRRHQTKAGAMILSSMKRFGEHFLPDNDTIIQLKKDFIRHGDLGMMLGVIRSVRNQGWGRANIDEAKNWTLSTTQCHVLFRYGGTRLLKFFLDHKVVDPNTPLDGYGCGGPMTPLMLSSERIRWTSYEGPLTPLMLTFERKRFDLAQVLLNNGADINRTLGHGSRKTALIYATEKGYDEAVRFLRRNGAKKP